FAVRNLQLAQEQAEFLEIRLGLFRAGQLRLADDLQERRTRAIEIDEALPTAALLIVQHFAGVFFEMNADDANPLGPSRGLDLEPAVAAEGEIILADL